MNNIDFLDLITIISFVVGIKNLELNQEQVSNLEEHLRSQDSILIEQQNKMLAECLELLKEIQKEIKERKK